MSNLSRGKVVKLQNNGFKFHPNPSWERSWQCPNTPKHQNHAFDCHPNISLGSGKWLTETFYNKEKNNTEDCLKNLKKDGYKIIATSPHKAKSIYDINVKKEKVALLFGAEQEGLSHLALEIADEKVRIPMYGFTESYNISVAAALCMQVFISKIRKHNRAWQLSEEEKDEVMLNWLRKSIKESELIEKRFIQDIVSS